MENLESVLVFVFVANQNEFLDDVEFYYFTAIKGVLADLENVLHCLADLFGTDLINWLFHSLVKQLTIFLQIVSFFDFYTAYRFSWHFSLLGFVDCDLRLLFAGRDFWRFMY